VIGQVLEQWPHMFRVLSVVGKRRNNASVSRLTTPSIQLKVLKKFTPIGMGLTIPPVLPASDWSECRLMSYKKRQSVADEETCRYAH
jgi:hypothetical protein